MTEHEHDFRIPVISRPDRPPYFEAISGWRCECGARSGGAGASRAAICDPVANLRAAMRLYRDYSRRYPPAGIEEDTMQQQTTMRAPGNPHRQHRREVSVVGRYGTAMMGAGDYSVPRMTDTTGPGLLGADLDRMCRAHWRDGYAKAERDAEERIETMQEEHREALETAFDEGYTAGRVERAQGLAREVRSRLMGVHFELMAAETAIGASDTTSAVQRVPAVRAHLVELMAFVDNVADHEEPAAGQVARDES